MKPFLQIMFHVVSVVLAIVLAGLSILLSDSAFVHGGAPCTSSLTLTPCGKLYPLSVECVSMYYIDDTDAKVYTTRQSSGMAYTFPCNSMNCANLGMINYPPESGSCTQHPRTSVE